MIIISQQALIGS